MKNKYKNGGRFIAGDIVRLVGTESIIFKIDSINKKEGLYRSSDDTVDKYGNVYEYYESELEFYPKGMYTDGFTLITHRNCTDGLFSILIL